MLFSCMIHNEFRNLAGAAKQQARENSSELQKLTHSLKLHTQYPDEVHYITSEVCLTIDKENCRQIPGMTHEYISLLFFAQIDNTAIPEAILAFGVRT